MSQDPDNVLRRSLDAVDRQRRRLIWVLALVTVTVAWEFYRLTEVKPTGDVPRMIVQAVMALFFWTLFLVVLVISQLTIATKRILRAIELSSKPAE